MRIFDPHIHMTSRTTDDYRAMRSAGVRLVVEPSFWLGQPRTSVESFVDYFDTLLGWEPFRAAQFGVGHYCAVALNPKEANDPRCAGVLDLLPRYLAKDSVVAVGEIGFDSATPAEEKAFTRQLELAVEYGLPALVHTPHRDKAEGTARSLALVERSGIAPAAVAIDHLNEVTVAQVAASGCWMGFSIYPDTKMDPVRMVRILQEYGTERVLVNSAADWGVSDPLRTRATGEAMLAAGFTEDDVDRVLWRNPVAFYGQSGRLRPEHLGEGPATGRTAPTAAGPALHEGNSVLRGSG
ncbi:TatD family hydrolase [Streptomyces sp. NPDC006514]|uniref:TatD family hydrolase n=1 Tax=Streptomyces sp. NPDC006514 TaxID=3154308 RepID=UPI00339F5E34